MSNEKLTKAEFFIDEPPPVLPVPQTTAAAASSDPTIAIAGVGQQLIIADKVPDRDDPSVLLRSLTGRLAAAVGGPMTGEQLAQEAERSRHNAHVSAEGMIDRERRRQRQAKGKPGKPGKR